MAASAGAVYVDVKANTKPFEGSMGGLGAVAGKFGKVIGAALGGAALVGFGKQCIELASDLNEVQNVVDVTFGTMSGQLNDWASSAADTFGLSETMAKRFAGTFGSMAEAFGFTEQQAYGMSTTLAGLAGDVASFYNISQDAAYTKLKSVFSGETESLKELGVVMTQAALDQFALANGYGATTSQMTEQEKVALRLAFVQNALSNATGDFARTSGSWANQVRLLSLRFEQFRAAIGQSLIAVLLPVVRGLNAIILAATYAAQAFGRLISVVTGKSMSELTGGVQQVSVDLGGAAGAASDLADSYDDAAGSAGGAAKAQEDLNRAIAGFDKINRLSSSSSSGGSGGGGSAGGGSAGGGLGDSVAGEVAKAQGALDTLTVPQGLLDAIQRVKDGFSNIADTLSGGFAWAVENVLKPLADFTIGTVLPDSLNLLADALGHVNDFLKDVGDPLGRVLKSAERFAEFAWGEILQPLLDFGTNEVLPRVLDALGTAFDVIVTCFEKLQPVFMDLWEHGFKPLGEFLGDVFLGALDLVNAALDWLLDCVSKADFEPFVQWMHDANDWLNEHLTPAFEALGDAARWVWDNVLKPIGDFLTGIFRRSVDDASASIGGFSGVWDGIKSKTVELVAEAKEKVSGALAKLGEAWDGVKDKVATLSAKVETAASAVKDWWDGVVGWWRDKTASLTGKQGTAQSSVKTWWKSMTSPWVGKVANLKGRQYTKRVDVKSWWDSMTRPWREKVANLKGKSATKQSTVSSWWTSMTRPWKEKSVWLKSAQGTSSKSVGSWWGNMSSPWVGKSVWLTAAQGTSESTVSNWWQKLSKQWYGKTVYFDVEVRKTGINGVGMKTYTDPNTKNETIQAYAFAQGGYVARNTPRLAIIGDNRREGEIISPESKFQSMLDKAAGGSDASALLPVLTDILNAINGLDTATYLDGQAITRSVVSNVNAQTRATGRSPILV